MKPKANPRRLTLYMPLELSIEMQKYPDINWSAVAQDAYIVELVRRGNEYATWVLAKPK